MARRTPLPLVPSRLTPPLSRFNMIQFDSNFNNNHLTTQPTSVEAWSSDGETVPYLGHRSLHFLTQPPCQQPSSVMFFYDLQYIQCPSFPSQFHFNFPLSCETSELPGGGTVAVRYILKTQVKFCPLCSFGSVCFSTSLEPGGSTLSSSILDPALPFVKYVAFLTLFAHLKGKLFYCQIIFPFLCI